jgi:hypothetical protein
MKYYCVEGNKEDEYDNKFEQSPDIGFSFPALEKIHEYGWQKLHWRILLRIDFDLQLNFFPSGRRSMSRMEFFNSPAW